MKENFFKNHWTAIPNYIYDVFDSLELTRLIYCLDVIGYVLEIVGGVPSRIFFLGRVGH